MEGNLYLIHEREFIKTKEHVYKIGRAIDIRKRLLDYPNQSRLIFTMYTRKLDTVESELKKIFKQNFTQRKDIGTEYFEGNVHEMIQIICNHIISCNDCHIITDMKEEKLKETAKKNTPRQKKSPKTKMDLSIACDEFVNENREEISTSSMPQDKLYKDFHAWAHTKNYTVSLASQKLMKCMKSKYNAEIDTVQEADVGVINIIRFPNLMPDLQSPLDAVKNFINEYLDITGNDQDMIGAAEMHAMFSNSSYYNGKGLAWFKNEMIKNNMKHKKNTRRGQYYTFRVYYGVRVKTGSSN